MPKVRIPMRLAIVTLAKMPASMGQYYNAQDVGLARALAVRLAEQSAAAVDGGVNAYAYVDVYNFVESLDGAGAPAGRTGSLAESVSDLGDGVLLHRIQCAFLGVHSLCREDFFLPDCDGAIVFSDNQVNFGYIRRLCHRRGIFCLPYVGVLGSNSGNAVKSLIMNILTNNVKYYRKMKTLAKTPGVAGMLREQGVDNVVLAPVCLNGDMLRQDYASHDREGLKSGLGISGRAILFVGRLCQEKHPLEMLGIYERLLDLGNAISLVMIGKGELEGQVRDRIGEIRGRHPDKAVITLIDKVDNSRMWKYYRSCVCMVNLNDHEIFGMSILEAMYYELPVVAIKAPGPGFIMNGCGNEESGSLGLLCDDYDQIVQALGNIGTEDVAAVDVRAAHAHIVNDFMWDRTAEIILGEIK
jgi:1,2-diacylglycerol 3-alpha-glucosyltransferase